MVVISWIFHIVTAPSTTSAWVHHQHRFQASSASSNVVGKTFIAFGCSARCASSHDDGFEFKTASSSSTTSAVRAKLLASDAIPVTELSVLLQLISTSTPLTVSSSTSATVGGDLPPGATGRAVILKVKIEGDDDDRHQRIDIDEGLLDEWQADICQRIDEILYSDNDFSIRQPLLLSLVQDDDNDSGDDILSPEKQLQTLIDSQIRDYGLAHALQLNHKDRSPTKLCTFVPSFRWEVDGVMVLDDDNEDGDSVQVWDTSSILVFDDLVDPDLRRRMLEVVVGSSNEWNDAENGPDPSRWQERSIYEQKTNEELTSTPIVGNSMFFELTDVALEEICQDDPPPEALEAFEKILVKLFADFTVTRLPEAVFGAGVTPLQADAHCFGQSFDDHIDGDPFFAPPSPWTDVYGRYANRARGKPRFVSCLVHLNREWKGDNWGAPTRFYDVKSGKFVDVTPQPGRVLIVDADVTQTVVAPNEAAGRHSRYSLVWKLILHPKKQGQNMRQLSSRHDWYDPIHVGSAKG